VFKESQMKRKKEGFHRTISLFCTVLAVSVLPFQVAGGDGRSSARDGEDKPLVAILGSSLAAGWVTSRESRFDMQNGWAFRLERLLSERGFKTVNISHPGDTSEKALNRLEKDLFPLKPDMAVISLSLENEGIRGIGGKIPEQVYEGFKANLRRIIQRCRQNDILPILASCYPSDNYTEDRHYQYIKDMNLEMAGWDVPGINLLGPMDNGKGGFVQSFTFDLDHPDNRGHRELFYAVVPGLFKALLRGIPLPAKMDGSGGFAVGNNRHPAPLSLVPEDPIHSFAMAFEVGPESSGILAGLEDFGGNVSFLCRDARDGSLSYQSLSGEVLSLPSKPGGGENWLHAVLSHRHLKGETLIFLDGLAAGTVKEKILPVRMVLGGKGKSGKTPGSVRAEFRNWLVYRSALNGAEALALAHGKLLQPSLELYAPLDEEFTEGPQILVNTAQSTSRALAFPGDQSEHIAHLKGRIAALERGEKIFSDPDAKEPADVDPAVFDGLTGDYVVDDNLLLTVAKEGGRLYLLFNGGDMGKMELFPLSPNRFFMRIVGPEAEAKFLRDEEGKAIEVTLSFGPRTLEGKKAKKPLPPRAERISQTERIRTASRLMS
jgi:lysophospholipase L1-like esterase